MYAYRHVYILEYLYLQRLEEHRGLMEDVDRVRPDAKCWRILKTFFKVLAGAWSAMLTVVATALIFSRVWVMTGMREPQSAGCANTTMLLAVP